MSKKNPRRRYDAACNAMWGLKRRAVKSPERRMRKVLSTLAEYQAYLKKYLERTVK